MLAIELKSITKAFKRGRQRQLAVDDISFTLPCGKALGIIGANGAGKSTTIKCLLNFIRPDMGEISIFGLPVTDPRSRASVGFVSEKPIINDLLTPRDVLRLSLSYADNKGSWDEAIDHWLQKFDVAHVATKPLKHLSKGMQQRVALAAALVTAPKLLVLDEPLSGLDPIGRRDTVNILEQYIQAGGSLLFTSHVLHDVERLADYFCILHKGKLVLYQTAEELMAKSNYQVVAVDEAGTSYEHILAYSEVRSYIESQCEMNRTIVLVKPELSLEKLFYSIIS